MNEPPANIREMAMASGCTEATFAYWECLPHATECLGEDGFTGVRAVEDAERTELRSGYDLPTCLPLAHWQSSYVSTYFGLYLQPITRSAIYVMFDSEIGQCVPLSADLRNSFFAFLGAAETGTGWAESDADRSAAIEARQRYWRRYGSFPADALKHLRVSEHEFCFGYGSPARVWGACSSIPERHTMIGPTASEAARLWAEGECVAAVSLMRNVLTETLFAGPGPIWFLAACESACNLGDNALDPWHRMRRMDWNFGPNWWSETDPAWAPPWAIAFSSEYGAERDIRELVRVRCDDRSNIDVAQVWSAATLVRHAANVSEVAKDALALLPDARQSMTCCLHKIGWDHFILHPEE